MKCCNYPDNIAPLRLLWQEAFGDTDAFLDCFFATAFRRQNCRCITEGDKVLAALYWMDCHLGSEKIAYLYAVATAKAARGKGLCHSLMADTHALLKEQGYMGTLLVPGSPSLRKLYQGMGYQDCCPLRETHCTAGAIPIPLQELDKTAFSHARQRKLGENALYLGEAGLAFLATQGDFYAGEDLLLVARREGSHLRILELLGDVTQAPGAVAALDAKTANLRTPGAGDFFAMYRPLKEGKAPDYYPFAFD